MGWPRLRGALPVLREGDACLTGGQKVRVHITFGDPGAVHWAGRVRVGKLLTFLVTASSPDVEAVLVPYLSWNYSGVWVCPLGQVPACSEPTPEHDALGRGAVGC